MSLATRPWPLRVLQISALDVVTRQELLGRLDRVAQLPAAARRGYAVQLRDPQLSAAELLAWGELLRQRTRALGAMLVVNDRLDIALALDADAVHLGRRSVSPHEARRLLGERRWLSASLHQPEDLLGPGAEQVDAWLLSPLYASPGKQGALGPEAVPRMVERLRLQAQERGRPAPLLVALGGLDEQRARHCRSLGADAVASIRAELSALLSFEPASV